MVKLTLTSLTGTGRLSCCACSTYRNAWRSDTPEAETKLAAISAAESPCRSHSSARFRRCAFCGSVARGICHKRNPIYDSLSRLFSFSLQPDYLLELEVIFCVRGVASPLLANLYLHWFDALLHGPQGPARRADVKLVRYADDFVALAKRMGSDMVEFIESRLEGKFQLEINREKTRVVNLREQGASLDFLGYTFRYDRDLKGRDRKYLNMFPSNKAVQRERKKLHEMTNSHQCFKPIPVLVGELNRHLKGWANYFSIGYPLGAYCEIERYVRDRLIRHLQRRSQRPYRPPPGVAWLGHLDWLGLIRLADLVHA
jgi:Group II intron, maturase-specific domain/Reverse transcriptase (RNA-dependent DNA polymerase)